MSEINQQIINCDLQNQLLNQSQILHPRQQTWSPNTPTELTKKKRMNSIKIVYPKQFQNPYEERQMFTKSQTKKKVFDKRRILTNSFKTQICSKQSNQEALQLKQQQNDSQSYQSYITKRTAYKKNIFFDQIILSPKERLQSFRSHLKAVRQQNETYLKNKMNVIKQKIKRKIQNEPIQRSKGTFWPKKYEKNKDKIEQKQRRSLKIQKYDEQFEEDMIRKSIQIQKCQVLDYSSQKKFTIQQEEEKKVQTKPNEIIKQKRSIKQHPIFQAKQQMIIKGQNKIRINTNENQPDKEQSYKMMIVNRLSPLKNVVSVIKPEKSLEKKKIDIGGLQVGLFFNIKALDHTPSAQTTSHKYSKSFDISLMKKIDKKLSQETTAHNFIKGSVIYRLLKDRNKYKGRQSIALQVQNQPKKIQIQSKVNETKNQVANQQPVLQNKEVVQQPQKKKKIVVLSNKDITKYKSDYAGRIKYEQTRNRIDQYEESSQSQLLCQQQQKKR